MQSHNYIPAHHAHLWISDSTTLEQQAISKLQSTLCQDRGCKSCNNCLQIEQKQHPWITWLQPDGSYTLDEIDIVIESVRFKLDTNEKRFFIFTNAQDLTPACSNRLLKTIEEPHDGYFFIFLASRSDDILPTLISRCFVKQFAQQQIEHSYQEIMEPFIQLSFSNPSGFMKSIDRLSIKESQTKEIVDLLLEHFHAKLIKVSAEGEIDIQKMIMITDKIILLKLALAQLPLAGSSKLFWKNLYLTFNSNA
ncbi:MAG: hypothetical protein NTU89_01970 [Candidatus Dependentiae bacterium]|nr:hypothetical protein [Candidatus Dependentiae bacterium]